MMQNGNEPGLTNKPHVLFVANRTLGWNTYSQQLAGQLTPRDDINTSVLWRRPHRVSTLPVKRHDVADSARLYRRIDPITAYRGWLGRAIRREIQHHAPDVVHFGAHWPAAAYGWQDGLVPFTLALDCTMADMNKALPRPVWSDAEIEAEAELLRRAARVFPMSTWTARSVIEDAKVPEHRVKVIPPSIDLSVFRASVTMAVIPNIIFIGNDFARKGGDRLVKWVTGPLAGLCHLHIVSTDPNARVQNQNVTFHGKVPHDVLCSDLLPGMDLMCLPTWIDMSPHVLVEAAAAGIPAIASDIGGIADIVLHERTGLLCAPGDDKAFVTAIRRLIEDHEVHAQMQVEATRHAVATFDGTVNFGLLADELATLATVSQRNRQAGEA